MPTEIVLVRHGICTGNEAEKASRKGDHTLFSSEIRRKNSLLWPLLPQGFKQSEDAGFKIKQCISDEFDYYVTSDILRSVQTATGLGFRNAKWSHSVFWRERNWGGVENLPLNERQNVFSKLGISPSEDSLEWRPPRGESMVSVVSRVVDFLKWAKNNLSGKRLLIVSHGGPIQAMRVIQHGIKPESYAQFIGGDNYIRNCHVFQYSIRNIDDAGIPKFRLERSLFTKPNGDWIENFQVLDNH